MMTMNDNEKKLLKVHNLMALALGNAAKEEARTAALIAVQMIKDNSFKVVLGGSASQSSPPRTSTQQQSNTQRSAHPKEKRSASDYFQGIPQRSISMRAQDFVSRLEIYLKAQPVMVLSVRWMVDMAVKVRLIGDKEKFRFEYKLRQTIVRRKCLKAYRGRRGGYGWNG